MPIRGKKLTPAPFLIILIITGAIVFGRIILPVLNSDQNAPAPTATGNSTDSVPTGAGGPATPSWAELAAKPFDFYVLALSWSPDYCASTGSRDAEECALDKKLGFVLHGLWPENKRGYPSSCSTQTLDDKLKSQFAGLYPNETLYDHEWEKHGTCSGLTPTQYFSLARQLKQSITIPQPYLEVKSAFSAAPGELKDAFMQSNPGLNFASLAVNCSASGRYLTEVDICFARDGKPSICSQEIIQNSIKSCKNSDFLVRNNRQ